jgi:predicted nucleic-acid-binding protein
MIGLDTNVLVRCVMQDDPKQSPKAGKLIDALDGTQRGFISVVSVVETVWVLSACYDLNREQVTQALDLLLHANQLSAQQADQVLPARRVLASSKAYFADCLIERSAAQAGCEKTMSFDVGATQHAGMTLIT